LCATCHIPILSGYCPYNYSGDRLYDGLFTTPHAREHNYNHAAKEESKEENVVNNNSKKSDNVIRISWTPNCECGCTDEANSDSKYVIAPAVVMPLRWTILPQKQENLRLVFYHGYCQAYTAFQNNPELQQMFSKSAFQNNFKSSKRISPSEVNLTDTSEAIAVCVNPLTDETENTAEEVLDMLMRDPICEADDSFWELTLINQKSIASYLSEEARHSNKQWSGCGGCIGYFCIFVRIFCACCPIVCCVQRCIREKKREKTKIQ
jgi:hypothetical protein